VYVLAVTVIGWVILRAETATAAMTFLGTMTGVMGAATSTSARYLTTPVWFALALAVVGAGPMIPAISRWRVSLDVAAASLLMMMTATGLFVWLFACRGWSLTVESLRLLRPRDSNTRP
jgi:hypothetical protein